MHIAGGALEGPSLPLHLITAYNEPARGCLQHSALVIKSAQRASTRRIVFRPARVLWSRDSCGERKRTRLFPAELHLAESVFPPCWSAAQLEGLSPPTPTHLKREGRSHVVHGDSHTSGPLRQMLVTDPFFLCKTSPSIRNYPAGYQRVWNRSLRFILALVASPLDERGTSVNLPIYRQLTHTGTQSHAEFSHVLFA